MKFSALSKSLTRVVKKVGFRAQKHAPEIMLAVGIGCGAASTVMACKATIKAQDILREAKEDIDAIHRATSDPDISETTYSDEDRRKDLVQVYVRTGVSLAKIYGPSILLGVGSAGLVVGSNTILRNRVNTAVAAYTALDAAFQNYRERIAEMFGQDKELEAYHNVKQVEGETRDEDGLVLADPKDTVKVDGYSIYARCFDEYNPNWKDDAEFNLMFLRGAQRYLNACLERDGYLFLNDAYKELGFPPSQAGQLVGWIYDPNRTDAGDNCVSFGLYNPTHGPALGDFINGNENAVFLDFNVDGVIIDRI